MMNWEPYKIKMKKNITKRALQNELQNELENASKVNKKLKHIRIFGRK